MEPQPNCPFNNFAPCKKLECALFIRIRGKHPQSHEDIDEYACAFAWVPILLIENSQEQRQTAAAVESFRNQFTGAMGAAIAISATGTKKNIQLES